MPTTQSGRPDEQGYFTKNLPGLIEYVSVYHVRNSETGYWKSLKEMHAKVFSYKRYKTETESG
jgi:hypothetical protein